MANVLHSLRLQFAFIAGMLFGISALFAGCSAPFAANVGFSSGASTLSIEAVNNSAGFAAFQNGFYAFVNKQGCVECHASVVHPTFAAADVNVAYASAKGTEIGSTTPLIDFTNPSQSIFIKNAGNGHCSAAPCSDPSVRPEVQSLLEAWAAAELNGSSQGGGQVVTSSLIQPTYLTATMPMPANIPSITAQAPAVVRFDLSLLSPKFAGFEDAILELSIELINANEYHITHPRIAGSARAVEITGIHVFIKPSTTLTGFGTEDTDQGNVWDSLNVMAPMFTLPQPLPNGPMAATPLAVQADNCAVQSASDMITVGFDQLQ